MAESTAPPKVFSMTAFVPEWAEPLESSLGTPAPSEAGADAAVVLIDASLLREQDPAWIKNVESTLGLIVAVCTSTKEASLARARGARAAVPASLLNAEAGLAFDVLSDMLATNVTSRTRLERFMCDAIHEFRTPLTVISEFAGLCEDGIGGELTERQADYIGYIQAAVDRMGQQFDDYRDGLRMRLGSLEHDPSLEKIGDIVASATDAMGADLAGELEQRNAFLNGVDGRRLAESVKRIVGGAQKLSAKGQQVKVELREPDAASAPSHSTVEIHVGYQGVVLSEEDVTVMDEGTVMRSNGFYRSVARVFGLGISMARLFLNQSGGSIRLELDEGVGGTFIAQIPVRARVDSGTKAATALTAAA